MSNEKKYPAGILELNILRAVLKLSVSDFLTCGLTDEFFVHPDDKKAFEFIVDHVCEFKVLPQLTTVVEAGFKNVGEVSADEPFAHYLKAIIKSNAFRLYNNTLKNSQEMLRNNEFEALTKLMLDAIKKYENLKRTNENIITSNDLISVYDKAVVADCLSDGIYTPWATANKYGAVLRSGDLGIIAGRPASGKTWAEVVIAHHAATVQGKKVLFISLEMSDEDLAFRYGAVQHKIDSTQFNKLELTTAQRNKIKANESANPIQFMGNSKVRSLDTLRADIGIYAPDLVIIDAAYLLAVGKGGKAGMSKYERISITVQGLKEIATEYQVPIIASYQINREGKKAVSKGEELDVGHIAGSDDIPQLASFVLLLDMMGNDDVERPIIVGKNRKGTKDTFMVEWNLQTLSFAELEGGYDDTQAQKVG